MYNFFRAKNKDEMFQKFSVFVVISINFHIAKNNLMEKKVFMWVRLIIQSEILIKEYILYIYILKIYLYIHISAYIFIYWKLNLISVYVINMYCNLRLFAKLHTETTQATCLASYENKQFISLFQPVSSPTQTHILY